MQNDDVEVRLTTLEHEVSRLREESAATRALAALADRDVSEIRSELRSHNRVLNALRETQLEHGRKLEEHGRKIDEGFAKVAVGMAQITALLTQLIDSERDDS